MKYRDALELCKNYPNSFRFASDRSGDSDNMQVFLAFRSDKQSKKSEITEMYKRFQKDSKV